MSDITKCSTADKCPKRDRCWRHVAPDHENQSWAMFWDGEGECEWFMPIGENGAEKEQK